MAEVKIRDLEVDTGRSTHPFTAPTSMHTMRISAVPTGGWVQITIYDSVTDTQATFEASLEGLKKTLDVEPPEARG